VPDVWQSRFGILAEGEKVPDTDPRKILHSVTTYLAKMPPTCAREQHLETNERLLPPAVLRALVPGRHPGGIAMEHFRRNAPRR